MKQVEYESIFNISKDTSRNTVELYEYKQESGRCCGLSAASHLKVTLKSSSTGPWWQDVGPLGSNRVMKTTTMNGVSALIKGGPRKIQLCEDTIRRHHLHRNKQALTTAAWPWTSHWGAWAVNLCCLQAAHLCLYAVWLRDRYRFWY